MIVLINFRYIYDLSVMKLNIIMLYFHCLYTSSTLLLVIHYKGEIYECET